jgi:hypothetical protein
MTQINYELIDGGKRGRLLSALYFTTPIKGHTAYFYDLAHLEHNGELTIFAGFEWDFASGAIDTPAMVIASAAHDVFCLMTDLGLLPWECRAQSDKYFRDLLKAEGVGFARRWYCWAAVRAYSKTVAYWRRKK